MTARAVGRSVGNDSIPRAFRAMRSPSSMALLEQARQRCEVVRAEYDIEMGQLPRRACRHRAGRCIRLWRRCACRAASRPRTGTFFMVATCPMRRTSAASRTQQVMKTTISASSMVSTWQAPRLSSMPRHARSRACSSGTRMSGRWNVRSKEEDCTIQAAS